MGHAYALLWTEQVDTKEFMSSMSLANSCSLLTLVSPELRAFPLHHGGTYDGTPS
jgi:hypothetical protein